MPPSFAGGTSVWQEPFTYTDASSADSLADWVAPGISGSVAMGIAGGTLQRVSGSGWSAAVSASSAFDRVNKDYVFELYAPPDTTNQMILGVLGFGTDTGGYTVNVNMGGAGNSRCRLQRWSGGSVQATHVDVTDAKIAAGDAVGIRFTSTTVALWRRISGTWAQVGATATDSTYSTGTITVETNAGATRIDAIGSYSNADDVQVIRSLASLGVGS